MSVNTLKIYMHRATLATGKVIEQVYLTALRQCSTGAPPAALTTWLFRRLTLVQ